MLEIRVRQNLGDLLCAGDPSLVVAPLESREIGSLFVAQTHADPSVRDFFGRFNEVYSWTGFKDETFRENLALLAGERAQLFAFRPHGSDKPMADYYLSCVGGNWAELGKLSLSLRSGSRAWAEGYLEERRIATVPLLALAPGSGAREKNWPVQHFAAISEWWCRYGKSLWILGPVERERGQDAGSRVPGALAVEGLSLDQLAALLARCQGMVGNDSGTTHLAAAVGIPTLAVFGPTDPVQWQPWGPRVSVIASNLPCAPCGLIGMKGCSHQSCLRELEPGLVIRAVKEKLFPGYLDK